MSVALNIPDSPAWGLVREDSFSSAPPASAPAAARKGGKPPPAPHAPPAGGRGARAAARVATALAVLFFVVATVAALGSVYGVVLTLRRGFGPGASSPWPAAHEADGGAPPPIFTCPDGRRGLHVVNMRFLVGQPTANLTFVASRLLLLQTFAVPSLAAQTERRFGVVVTTDRLLPAAWEAALGGALAPLGRRALVLRRDHDGREAPEQGFGTGYSAMRGLLEARALVPADEPFDLYLVSRLDGDDAAATTAVAATQAAACARRGEGPVRTIYQDAGLMWYPAAGEPHGEQSIFRTDRADGVERADPLKARPFATAMQTLALEVGRPEVAACPITAYSWLHIKPWHLEGVLNATCPALAPEFDRRRDIVHTAPPPAGFGFLWTRSPASKSFALQRHAPRDGDMEPASAALFAANFGLDPAALAFANLLFSGLHAEAPHTLVARSLWWP